MKAIGIHAHESRKLGLKHTDRNRVALVLRWKSSLVPAVPPVADHFNGWKIGLDGNDTVGDCGPTSVDNHRRMTTALLTGHEVETSQADVFDLYRRSGNPTFDPATGAGDDGVDMHVMLDALRDGGIAGEKVLAFAKLVDLSDASVMAAIDVFGGVLFAVDLQTAQKSQSDELNPVWDYEQTGLWGGHAIVAAAYSQSSGRIDVGSWGQRIGTTSAFRRNQLREVWIPLWPELLQSGRFFDSGIDLSILAGDYRALTGQEFPAPLPTPPPQPTPPPTPVPPPQYPARLFTLTFGRPVPKGGRVVFTAPVPIPVGSYELDARTTGTAEAIAH